MPLSPIASTPLIQRNRLETTAKEYIIKNNIVDITNSSKELAPPLPPRKKWQLLIIYYFYHAQ